MPQFSYNADSVAVSADFINNKMPEANGAYVKVYLYALYLAASCIQKTDSDIARALNLLESDVVNAYDYWIEKGAMSKTGNSYIIGGADDINENIQNQSYTPIEPESGKQDIAERMTEDKTMADLVLVAQETLQRTLSDSDIRTLYWFYDELGFSAEVIYMLLEYCVSKDKRNMKYIEKVAISWHKNGITTMAAAENYMEEEREKSGYFYSIRKVLGIADRNLSKTEELYLKSWRDDYGMSEEMVALAYEYCVIQTGKLSFPYMNAIIKRWYNKNILTLPAAEEDHENFRAENGNQYDKELSIYKDSTDYDYQNIENRMREKYDD